MYTKYCLIYYKYMNCIALAITPSWAERILIHKGFHRRHWAAGAPQASLVEAATSCLIYAWAQEGINRKGNIIDIYIYIYKYSTLLKIPY